MLDNTLDASGNISGWILYVFEDDSIERYDAYGRLLSVQMRNGWRYTLTYKSGRLDKVTNPFGRVLGFRYDTEGRMSRLIDPAGGEIIYGYDDRGNMNRVTWQDKKFRRYHYEDKRFPSCSPASLTKPTCGWRPTAMTISGGGRNLAGRRCGSLDA